MAYKFDLKAALDGEAVINGRGDKARNVHISGNSTYCLSATVYGVPRYYTEGGLAQLGHSKSQDNLFMEAPPLPKIPRGLQPFNLTEAFKGNTVCTRNFLPVEQLKVFRTDELYPLFAVVEGQVKRFQLNGKHKVKDNVLDLFMVSAWTDNSEVIG